MATQSALQDTNSASARHGDAEQFKWLNDPNTTIGFDHIVREFSGDTFTAAGVEAINLTDHRLPEVGLFVPFAWPRIDNPDGSFTLIPLDWSNSKHGWYTPDFNGTGISLLVTLDISGPGHAHDGKVVAGTVAEGDPPEDVFGPSSGDLGIPYPEETLEPKDRVPFIDLGRFAPGEAKSFDLAFTYEWGDHRSHGGLRTAFAAFTLAPVEDDDHGHGNAGMHYDSVF